jgi:2-phospho-L-lactate/phosphoenolpyruvate guanylyltransferase
MRDPDWSVVVPVKRLAEAKSRLRMGRLPVAPERLALAMARDTVAAVSAATRVSQVFVVPDEPEVVTGLADLKPAVVPDHPGGGLNRAIAAGASATGTGWVAAIPADLPALRPEDLDDALAAIAGSGRPGFVADAPGTGTTLLATVPGHPLVPRFGAGSAHRHAAAGAHRLTGHWPSLRQDVDTERDLAAAVRLGVGPATGALWRESP